MTGVRSRRIADKDTCTSDLCVVAAQKLMSDLHWEPSSIDGIVLVTQTPDYRLPATSCVIQDRLALPSECAAFDVNLGCSGYVYGLWMVCSMISTGSMKRMLLLVGDTMSKGISPEDRSTTLLFGDAGTATALEYDDGAPDMTFALGTDGAGVHNLIIPAGGYREQSSPQTTIRRPLSDGSIRSREDLFMDGGEIFNFTIKRVPTLVKLLLEETKMEIPDMDYIIFHQANKFILNYLAKKLKLAPHQVPMSISQYGNTSSGSIPLTMASELAMELRQGDKDIALIGFGVGYSWAGVLTRMAPLQSLGMLEI